MDKTLSFKEKILLAQAAKERSEIISKYDKGRENVIRHDIDPWEDPEFQVYHVTDRYGFVHEKPLEKDNEKVKSAEIARSKKWVKMLHCDSWHHYYPGDKLSRRVYKGIPLAVRGYAWSKLLDIPKLLKDNEGTYERMKLIGRKWSLEVRQVDLDVNRTFRDHVMFRKRYDVKQQALFNVLVAYSMYNSEVGYCQGMSQIAALVLMYLNEEDAFWALVSLLNGEKHKMHGFFVPGFPKLLRFQEHFNKALKRFLPKVKKHLDRNEMYPTLYSVKWFLQCFLDRTPFSLTLRFWDIYILEGEGVLIAMALTIMKLHRTRILKMNMEELMDFFQNKLSKEFNFSDDHTVSVLRATLEDLRKAKLDLPQETDESRKVEQPTKPLGAFEAPTVEQMINEFEKEHKVEFECSEEKNDSEGKSDEHDPSKLGSKLRSKTKLEIPADGGPDAMPSSMNHRFSQMIDLESESGTGEDAWREMMSEVTATSDRRSSETSFTGSEFPSPGISACSALSPGKRPNQPHQGYAPASSSLTPSSKSVSSLNKDLVLFRYCRMDKDTEDSRKLGGTCAVVLAEEASSSKSMEVKNIPIHQSRSSSTSSVNSQPHLRVSGQSRASKHQLLNYDHRDKSLSQLLQELNDLIPKLGDMQSASNRNSLSGANSNPLQSSTTNAKAFFGSDSEHIHSPIESLVVCSPGSPFNGSPNSELPWVNAASPQSPSSIFSIDSLNQPQIECEGKKQMSASRSVRSATTVCIITSGMSDVDTSPSKPLVVSAESDRIHRGSLTSLVTSRPIIPLVKRINSATNKSMEVKNIPIQHIPSKNNNGDEHITSAPPFSPGSMKESSKFDWPKRTVYWSVDSQVSSTKANSILMPIPVYHMQSVPVVSFKMMKVEPPHVTLASVSMESSSLESSVNSDLKQNLVTAICTGVAEAKAINNITIKNVLPLAPPKNFSKMSKVSQLGPSKGDSQADESSLETKFGKSMCHKQPDKNEDLSSNLPSKNCLHYDQGVQNGPIAEHKTMGYCKRSGS